ncbi:hypothetical protein MMC28_009278 [Mycoblastus sanguinarius]|nr:hypothetical protein [Mycoblastus sanguinarius]
MTNAPRSQANEMDGKPPYPPTTASLGGVPTVGVDVPICCVFLVLFLIGAICHMTIFQINKARGHKFVISGMMFGFCMSRIVTMVMRIVWATRPTNISVAIASQVFVAAGVVLLFVINAIFSQRIVRSAHPNSGWHPLFHWAFIALYVMIVFTLIMLIISVVQQFYTLNNNTKRIDHDIQLYGQTFYAVVSFLPILLVIGGLVIPRKTRVEKFGSGRYRTKIVILLTSTFLLCLGASFRAGVNYAGGKRPISDPAGYQSKACLYIFQFTVEIIVILLYIIVRVDRRFYVPDHSKGPGDYSRSKEENSSEETRGEGRLERIISPEEEVFDDMSPEQLIQHDENEKTKDEEKGAQRDEATAVSAPIATPASARTVTPPPTSPTAPQERVIQMSRD